MYSLLVSPSSKGRRLRGLLLLLMLLLLACSSSSELWLTDDRGRSGRRLVDGGGGHLLSPPVTCLGRSSPSESPTQLTWWRCERAKSSRDEQRDELRLDDAEELVVEPPLLLLLLLAEGRSPLSLEYLRRLPLNNLFELTKTKSLLGSNTKTAFIALF